MLCGIAAQNRPLCTGCHADLPRIGPCCPSCSVPRAVDGLCGACSQSQPAFDRITAVFPYRYPADAMIQDVKYRGRLPWLRLLAGELAARIRAQGLPLPTCLLPVPQHWGRRWIRGFNQALEVARELGQRLGLPVNDHVLWRPRPAVPQAGLPASARARNVRRAFGVRAERYAGEAVAIVDDVVTTGATVQELSRLLKRAGVREVHVWSLARASLHKP